MPEFDIEQYSEMPTTARFIMEQQDRIRQQALAQQQQMGVQSGIGSGLLGGFLGGLQAKRGVQNPYTDPYTGATMPQFSPVGIPPTFKPSEDYEPLFTERELHKFHRINEKATITKKDFKNRCFKEPLDELRIEVAQWLNN